MNLVIGLWKTLPGALRSRFPAHIFLLAFLVAGTPAVSRAGCHCFRDRGFDPARPDSADSYVLATARNSLLAAASEKSKNTVVKMRMTGSSETDLWLSLYLDSFWGQRDRTLTSFTDASRAKDRDAMAAALADAVLGRVFRAEERSLSELRSAGAGTAEITLSLLVSSRTRPGPMEVFTKVRRGETTWGKTLNSIGIALDSTGDLVADRVQRARE